MSRLIARGAQAKGPIASDGLSRPNEVYRANTRLIARSRHGGLAPRSIKPQSREEADFVKASPSYTCAGFDRAELNNV